MKTKQKKQNQKNVGLFDCIQWWTKQSFAGDKGGSFNLKLYFDYLKTIRP